MLDQDKLSHKNDLALALAQAHWDDALALAKTHVESSRKEEGCISHHFVGNE